MQLTNEVRTSIAHAPAAAGATDITDCAVIDMQNYHGCRFIVSLGTITADAVTSIHVKQAAAAASGTALTNGADLEGTSISIADDGDNKLYILDVYRPRERYLQLQIKRATANAVLNLAIAEQYEPRKVPVTKSDDVGSQEIHISPEEGTP